MADHGEQTQPSTSQEELDEANLVELQRSERVVAQLRAVLQSLRQRCGDLEAENALLLRASEDDEDCARLGRELSETREVLRRHLQERSEVEVELRRYAEAEAEAEANSLRCLQERDAARAAAAAFRAAREQAEAQLEATSERARSMVTQEALRRATLEAEEVRQQVVEQEAEAARLRQALADSWASRIDDPFDEAPKPPQNLEDLEGVEEALEFLAKLQQDAASEVHRVQRLERSEAALQSRLKELSEEKAALQSARVDLGDAGRAMREAIASVSDTYVRRVGGLEEARRSADEDRVKLIQECVDLQAELDSMTSELASLSELEGRHARLESERRALSLQSERLRDVNAALTAQLLAGEGGAAVGQEEPGGGQPLARVLALQRRLLERQQAQEEERQQLAERIRALERAAARPDELPASAPVATRSSREAPAAAPPPGPLSALKGSLQGGLGFLREGLL